MFRWARREKRSDAHVVSMRAKTQPMDLPRYTFSVHFLVLAIIPCWAQESGSSDRGGWFARVARAQAAQPHWITPVVTVTPRLEEEFRYDISEQAQLSGAMTEIYGGSKGLELIPTEHIQVTVGVPPYQVHNQAGVHDGWGDVSFLVKYRVLSKNEDHGNYILTAFLGATLPTGEANNGAAHVAITPWVAAGKGWGHFSVQTTLGITLSAADTRQLGRPILSNAAFQYRMWQKLWPEFEVNSTFWRSGDLAGKKQVFLTPGLVIGRLHLTGRLRFAFGAGFQIAATQFHTYNHKLVFTIRFPFA